MLILVSGATTTLRELRHPALGHLLVPRARNRTTSMDLRPGAWAMDNGAFLRFDATAFLRMLHLFRDEPGCLFTCAPDRVGDARTTLVWFPQWAGIIRSHGYPVALVAQDGLTVSATPWDEFEALFIGGTTNWKDSRAVDTLAGYAKARGKWLHMGRVNTKTRLLRARAIGCDLIDGSGFSKWPKVNLPLALRWLEGAQA